MFVFSVKTDRKQLWTTFGCTVLLAVAVITAIAVPSPAVTASVHVSSAEQRLAYVRACGFEPDIDSEEVREVRLPDEPDETVAQYTALQAEGERLLEPYYGKRVRLYTYDAVGEDGAATVHVYVYHNRVIAGDSVIGDQMQVLSCAKALQDKVG